MNQHTTKSQRLLTTVLSIVVAMMFSFTADAASCKGKPQSSCSADSSCSWVTGYKRKDGVQVSGHCRAASGKASSEKSQKKSSNKKTDTKAKKDKSSKDKKAINKKVKKDKKTTTNKKVKKDKKAKKDKKTKKDKTKAKDKSKK